MKLAALTPFPFHTGGFGGAERILNLLTRVQHPIDVFVPAATVGAPIQLANLTIKGVQLPDSVINSGNDYDTSLSEVAGDLFSEALDGYDLTILEHPWQVDALEGRRFIYDAHNNESRMKSQLFPHEVPRTEVVEAKALKAEHVTFCSLGDDLATESPTTHIPNGTDLPDLTRVNGSQVRNLLFVGSAHPPNIAAAVMLANLAQALPDYTVVIAGACSQYIQNPPSNVRLAGHVTPAVLDFLFANTHAFINIITAGSGTSLKIARALSYGIPVISSPLGARGYEESCMIASSAQEVVDALEMLSSAKVYKEQSDRARTTAEGLSWDKVGQRFSDVVLEVLHGNS
jgi:hypothetical protein